MAPRCSLLTPLRLDQQLHHFMLVLSTCPCQGVLSPMVLDGPVRVLEQQQADDGNVAKTGCHDEGGPPLGVRLVDVSPLLQQELGHVDEAAP